MEVAEHLPPELAMDFVNFLCQLSDIILFSAATSGQGGTNHVNEQRLSFWKNLFNNNNFKMYDLIRPQIWSNSHISPWYKQNSVIFSKNKIEVESETFDNIVDVVHPEILEMKSKEMLDYKKLSDEYRVQINQNDEEIQKLNSIIDLSIMKKIIRRAFNE
jgi:hypothetical protein